MTERNRDANRTNAMIENAPSLLDATQIATIFLDRRLCITHFTPAMMGLFGLREADIGRTITDIAGRLSYADLPTDAATVLYKQEIVERQMQAPEGVGTYLMQMRPHRAIDATVVGVVITFVDVSEPKRRLAEEALLTLNRTLEQCVADRTVALEAALRALRQQTEERQHAEAMLRQAQKLDALGKLTGGIAHDFNNLLGVIIGNAEFLLDAIRDDPNQAELAHEILRSALSGAELSRRLLAFARLQPLQPRLIDLNTLLLEQAAMLGRTLGESIRITTKPARELWLTNTDPFQIGNALLNLALNARHAMPRGGSLAIETANVHLTAADVAKTHDELSEGNFVALTVSDTGTGMSADVVARATEPFFTTKPASAGSGLGLSMVYGFVRQSCGHLTIDSEIGVGTTVRLYLPRAEDKVASVNTKSDEGKPRLGGNEAILLVDDNLRLLGVTQRRLIALGYRVSVAGSGLEALSILQSSAAFDLLFTDVVMPEGMSGYDLADAARVRHPGLRLLFTTGYVGEHAETGGGTHRQRRVLHKPYQLRDLAQTVRAALDDHFVLPDAGSL